MSVLLPTLEWGAVCEQLYTGLGPEDELLVICDTDTDPVAGHDPPDGVEILVAGEPEGCSGKANALAYGMERANNDRFVWTDDDFDRHPRWLDRLIDAGETHGPASAIPLFCGGGWWRLFEPWYGAFFTLLFYLQIGDAADTAWGGGVTFTRAELTVDVPTLTAELRTVLSDDYLLGERLSSVYPIRSMVTPVAVSGAAEAVRHRIIRFIRIVGVNEGWAGLFVAVPLAAVGLLYPLVIAPVLTLAFAGVYLGVGARRPNFLFAYVGLLLLPVAAAAGLLIETFEWAGRRYRFDNDGAVEVLESR